MPIHGISDKRRLSRVGKLRLGIKDKNAKGVEFPKSVDYFVCNEDKSTTEMAALMFNKAYPDKPKAIDIVFPSDNTEEFFPQYYKRYGSSKGLVCKGDGTNATRLNEESNEMEEIECTLECEYLAKKHCRAVGSLQFMIPHVSGLGVWQIDTGSYNSIVNINSCIDAIKAVTSGRIAFIPLKLVIRPREVQPNGKKKTVHVLDIAMEELNLTKVVTAALDPASQYALPAGVDNKPEELYPAEGEVINVGQDVISKEDIRASIRELCLELKMNGEAVRAELRELYKTDNVDELTLSQLIDYKDQLTIIRDMG